MKLYINWSWGRTNLVTCNAVQRILMPYLHLLPYLASYSYSYNCSNPLGNLLRVGGLCWDYSNLTLGADPWLVLVVYHPSRGSEVLHYYKKKIVYNGKFLKHASHFPLKSVQVPFSIIQINLSSFFATIPLAWILSDARDMLHCLLAWDNKISITLDLFIIAFSTYYLH